MSPIQILINSQANLQGFGATQQALGNLQSQLSTAAPALGGLTARFSQLSALTGPVAVGLAALAAAVGTLTLAYKGLQISIQRTSDAIDRADSLGKLAQKTQMTSEQLSQLAYAGKLADLSLGDIQIGVKELTKWMEENGQSGRDLIEVITEQADGFKRAGESVQFATDRFGRSGQAWIPLLSAGGAQIHKTMEEAKDFGQVVGSEFSANAQAFNDNLTRIKLALQGVWNQLADALLPDLIHLSEVFLDLIKNTGLLKDAVNLLVGAYKALAAEAAVTKSALVAWWESNKDFVSSLLTTGNPFEAWRAGMTALRHEALMLQNRLEAIAKIGQSRPATPITTEPKEKLWTKDTLDRELKRLDQLKEKAAQKIRSQELSLMGNGMAQPDWDQMRSRVNAEETLLVHLANLRTQLLQIEVQKTAVTEKQTRLSEALEQGALNQFDHDQMDLAVKREALDLDKQALELDEKMRELRIDAVRNNFRLTDAEKFSRISALTPDSQERAGLGPNPNSLTDQMTAGLVALRNEWGTFSQQLSSGFWDTFKSGINSISEGITGLILQTKTWGQALLQIGTTLLTSVVNAIVQIGVRWVATQIAMAIAGQAILASSTAATAPIAAAQSAIWTTPATLATIASYGGAAMAAPGFIAGATAISHALTAALSAVPAREFGGPVSAGQMYLVGEKRPELFVPSQNGTILPSVPSASGAAPVSITFAGLFDSTNATLKALDSAEGRAFLINFNRQTIHEVTGRG